MNETYISPRGESGDDAVASVPPLCTSSYLFGFCQELSIQPLLLLLLKMSQQCKAGREWEHSINESAVQGWERVRENTLSMSQQCKAGREWEHSINESAVQGWERVRTLYQHYQHYQHSKGMSWETWTPLSNRAPLRRSSLMKSESIMLKWFFLCVLFWLTQWP